MKNINIVALLLVIIGAINWGLVGIFNFNLVTYLFGNGSFLQSLIYILIGISGICCIGLLNKIK